MPETSVTFEYCMEGIDDFKKEPQKAVVNALRARDKLQSAYPDIGINMWPYARVKSVLSGGRKAVFDKKQLMEISQRFNRSGTPFILAWNGGIGMQKNLEIDWDSPHFRHVYKLLAHLQGGHPDNAVTLMRDDVLDQVCEAFPYLKKIASCMKFMGGKRGEFSIEPGDDEYDRAMRDDRLDYIVPANQHSTPEFLHRFRDRIEKLILFLDLKCSRSNMHECLLHMAEFEKLHHSRRDAWYFDLDDIVPKEDFVSIPSALSSSPTHGCYGGNLIKREADLQGFLDMRANKFKLHDGILMGATTNFFRAEIKKVLDFMSGRSMAA